MDLNFIRYYIAYLVRQSPVQVRDLTPEEFTDLLNICQLVNFKKKIGLPEEYQPNNPQPRQSYEITRKISHDLRKFMVYMGQNVPPLFVNTDGFAYLPSDCYYPSAMRFKYIKSGVTSYKKVDLVTDEQFFDRQNDYITKPTKKHPIANIIGDMVRVEPRDLKYIEFDYLRRPVDCYFAIDDGVAGYNAYDATNSVQLEWDDVNVIDIIALVLERIGVNLTRDDILKFGEQFKQQGQ